jgi:hypothetical protein
MEMRGKDREAHTPEGVVLSYLKSNNYGLECGGPLSVANPHP